MLAMSPSQSTLSFPAFSDPVPPQQLATSLTDNEVPSDEGYRTNDVQIIQTTVDSQSRESTPLSITTSLSSRTPQKAANTTDMANSKKRKLTDLEREVLEIEKKHKQIEREAERVKKEEEKRVREEAKRMKEEEKEEKRRLREQEKAVKDAEKSAKDAEKEEKRKQKELERLAKDEEKRLKDEAKELERKTKEEEQRAKEQEKQKKERAQLRLNSFFIKPAAPTQPKNIIKAESSTEISTTSSTTTEATEKVEIKAQSEFEKAFPPFFLHAHTVIASRPTLNTTKPQSTQEWLQTDGLKLTSLCDALPPRKRRCRRVPENVKFIIDNLSKPDQNLGSESQQVFHTHYEQMLKEIPLKTLKFAEDVRPPYVGTATKETTVAARRHLRRNPCSRALPVLNYDYDSEAEWDEPEEGEELGSEDEEEANEDDEEDMDGFLDDADSEKPVRRQALGDIEVSTTGLVWETTPRNREPVSFGGHAINMQNYRMQSLLSTPITSIDPFSTAYWSCESKQNSGKPNDMAAPASRTPLSVLKSAGNLPINTFLVPSNIKQDQGSQVSAPLDTNAKPNVLQTRAKPIPTTLLEPFKACILDNAEHTKLGLIEILKKNFPTLTKSTVQETLLNIAKREGKSNTEKKWILCA